MRRAVLLALFATARLASAAPPEPDDVEDDEASDVAGPRSSIDGETRVAGPPIGAVLAAAYAAAGLDRDPGRGWIRRARLAGLIPWVSVRTGTDTSWKEEDPTIGHGAMVEVRATWRLDRLVFDGRELQVASLESARRRERRRLANRVIRSYFMWRRAAAASVSQPRWISHADEAAAELDSMTDGWFTEALTGCRRTASETRTP
jgi:hypothetical protein